MTDLTGKVAIVTGAARGIGLAVSRLFIARGAKVVLTDLLDAGAAAARELGDSACFLQHDVTDSARWTEIVDETERRFGLVNVLVNNAGVSVLPDDNGTMRSAMPTDDCPIELYRRIVEINQVAVLIGMQAVIALMREAGGGAIINTSSAAGLVAVPGSIAYTASKFAVTGMTKAAAVDLGKYGIRVNAVHPGMVNTPMMAAASGEGLDIDQFVAHLPIPRAAQPAEIAEVYAFLASDAASFCTGASYPVDGGWTAT